MHRRHFLAGLSGVVLAACSGGSEETTPPSSSAASTPEPTEATSGPTTSAASVDRTSPPAFDWRPTVPALAPFALGVASGDPTADGVLIWTRLIDDPATGSGPDGPVEITWRVAVDPDLSDVVATGTIVAEPAAAHTVQVVVDGLDPGRTWFYGFETAAGTSMVGRTRTAPLEADRVTIAVASCQRFQDGTYVAHRHLAEAEIDLVVFLGDVIYADAGGDGSDTRPFDESRPGDLDGFRSRHARYRSDPDLQACLAAHPWVVTRDDNDVANGWGPDHPLRRPAEQAVLEHHPMRRASDDDFRRVVRWGDLADLVVLDVRPHRSERAGRASGLGAVIADDAMADDSRTMLGAEQEAWLGDALSSSTARWQLVASQVMVGDLSIEVGGDRLLNNDQWDGYPAARRRLLGQLAAASAPIVVAGDLHSGVVDVLRDDDGAAVATELVTPSISSQVDDRIATALAAAPIFQPDLLEVRGGVNGWVEVTLGAERAQGTIVVLDATDASATPATEISVLIDRGIGEPTVTG